MKTPKMTSSLSAVAPHTQHKLAEYRSVISDDYPALPAPPNKRNRDEVVIPPALATIAMGRDHVTTAEFAQAISRAAQTIRKHLCLTGAAFGLRPVKLGGRLLWPVVEIAAILAGA